MLVGNGLWYGVVREYEAISYQFIQTFFTSHKRSYTTKTRMHYTMCWRFVVYSLCSFLSTSIILSFRLCVWVDKLFGWFWSCVAFQRPTNVLGYEARAKFSNHILIFRIHILFSFQQYHNI